MENFETDMAETLITLTSDIVAAHVSNNSVEVGDVPTLISNVYSALSGLSGAGAAAEPGTGVRQPVRKRTNGCRHADGLL